MKKEHDAINKSKEAVRSKFSAHRVSMEGIDKMSLVRRNIRGIASAIEMLCPDGTEKEQAFLSLQSVMMFANSAIAQKYSIGLEEC